MALKIQTQNKVNKPSRKRPGIHSKKNKQKQNSKTIKVIQRTR